MSIPAVGDPAPRVALPDATGSIHDLADQRGRWTILYFYPKDDTPGCTVEACEFRDANETITERGADVWGISPQGATSKRKFTEKFGLPFTLLADEDHQARRDVRLVGREAELRQDVHGNGPPNVPHRPRGTHRAGLGEGQARGPRGGRPRSPRRAPSRACVIAAPACVSRYPDMQEASLVGGDERSLGRKAYAHAIRAARRVLRADGLVVMSVHRPAASRG